MFKSKVQGTLLILLIALSYSTPSKTQTTIVWNGAGDNSTWGDPDNWDLVREPQIGDSAVIEVTGSKLTVDITADAQTRVLHLLNSSTKKNLVVNFQATTFSITDLYLTNNSTSGDNILTIETGSLDLAGSLNVDASSEMTFDAGTKLVLSGSSSQVVDNAFAYQKLEIQNSNVSFGGSTTLEDSLIIGSGQTLNPGVDIACGSFLNIGTYTASGQLTLAGDLINQGNFSQSAGTILFDGSDPQELISSSDLTLTNISAQNDLTIEANIELTGTLDLGARVDLDVDGSSNDKTFILQSTSDSNSARIGFVPSNSSIIGNLVWRRFTASQGQIYRYLAFPINNQSVSDIQDDIPVTGTFTGASTCTGCRPNPSLYVYVEDSLGTDDIGWTAYPLPSSSNTDPLTPGAGYAGFMWNGSSDTVIDLTGQPFTGNLTYDVSFTNDPAQPDTLDGWNLLGNPYPSQINWTDVWSDASTKKMDPTAWVRDNGSGQLLDYNAQTMSSTNGWDGIIAPGQAFWVHANGNNPTLKIGEDKKSTSSTTFYRLSDLPNDVTISLEDSQGRDRASINFHPQTTLGYDQGWDSHQLPDALFQGPLPEPGLPRVASLTATGQKLATNYISRNFNEVEIDLSLSYQVKAHLTFELINDTKSNFELSLKNKSDGSVQEIISGQAILLSPGKAVSYSLLIRNRNYQPSVLEPQVQNLILYPNPVDNHATVILQSDYKGEIVFHLFNPLGDQTQHYSVSKNGELLHHDILMSGYPRGIYLLRVQVGEQSYVKRIIKN